MKQRVIEHIPEKYKDHPHKELFYLTFIQLEPLLDTNDTDDTDDTDDTNHKKMRLKESELLSFSHILNDLSFFLQKGTDKLGKLFTFANFDLYFLYNQIHSIRKILNDNFIYISFFSKFFWDYDYFSIFK